MILNLILGMIITVLVSIIYICYKRISFLVDSLEELNVGLEDCLDNLENSYIEIAKCAGEDVMSDDPIVRRVVTAVFQARNSVLKVSQMLASFEQNDNETPIESPK